MALGAVSPRMNVCCEGLGGPLTCIGMPPGAAAGCGSSVVGKPHAATNPEHRAAHCRRTSAWAAILSRLVRTPSRVDHMVSAHLLGDWRLDALLGAGGMGDVYL